MNLVASKASLFFSILPSQLTLLSDQIFMIDISNLNDCRFLVAGMFWLNISQTGCHNSVAVLRFPQCAIYVQSQPRTLLAYACLRFEYHNTYIVFQAVGKLIYLSYCHSPPRDDDSNILNLHQIPVDWHAFFAFSNAVVGSFRVIGWHKLFSDSMFKICMFARSQTKT